jgi:hypothetical protein
MDDGSPSALPSAVNPTCFRCGGAMELSYLEIGAPTYNQVYRCDCCGSHERIAIRLVRSFDSKLSVLARKA